MTLQLPCFSVQASEFSLQPDTMPYQQIVTAQRTAVFATG